MTQKEIKALASEIVGDGQMPNKFFVTTSPYVMNVGEFGDRDFELLENFTKNDSWTQVFDTYEEANKYFNDVELDEWAGIGQVYLEDRLSGTIKESYLEKIIKVVYERSDLGHSDAKAFGYEK